MFDTAMDALSGGVVPQQPSVPNSPDLDPSSPMNSQPNNAPAPQKQPSMWKQVLAGALQGMADGFGANTAAGGAQLAQHAARQRVQDAQNAANMQSEIKFRDTQSALNTANLARIGQSMQNENEQMQRERDDHAMKLVAFNQKLGVEYDAIPNKGEAAMQYLEQSHANNGGAGVSVPSGVIMSPSMIYVPKQGPHSVDSGYARLQKLAPLFGLPVPDKARFGAMTPLEQNNALKSVDALVAGHSPNGEFYDDKSLPKAITNLQAALAAYKNKGEYDANVYAQGENTLKLLQAQKTEDDKRFTRDEQSKLKIAREGRAAYNDTRVIEVPNPDKPGETMFVRAGNAVSGGVSGKGSASYTVPKKTTEYMTSGKGGQQITAYNAAISHLGLLDTLSEALNSTDVQQFNRAAIRWARETGHPEPTNFEAAKNAMAGEVAAALKATGATDIEIGKVDRTFNEAQSRKQLHGAIVTYRDLLHKKRDQLKGQYDAAQKGKPNFGGEDTPKAGGMVTMKAPNGMTKQVPADQVEHFKTLGATVVN